jgi:hypothetical protein
MFGDTGRRIDQWVNLAENTFEFACTARSRFANGDARTKREILATLGSNLILCNRILSIEAKRPFSLLENAVSPKNKVNTPNRT